MLLLDVCIVKYGIWNVNEPEVNAVNALVGSGYAPLTAMVLASRGIRTGAEADPNANYILMSTCAYVFEDARSVLLGKLVPLASAGGKAVSK